MNFIKIFTGHQKKWFKNLINECRNTTDVLESLRKYKYLLNEMYKAIEYKTKTYYDVRHYDALDEISEEMHLCTIKMKRYTRYVKFRRNIISCESIVVNNFSSFG